MRTPILRLTILAALLTPALLLAQGRTLHWVGGDGHWGDAARWSLAPGGPGGAGAPTAKDDAVIAPRGAAQVRVQGTAKCRSLRVDGQAGFVRIEGGEGSELRIHGDWAMSGSVHWALAGNVRLAGEGEGRVIDLKGIPVQGGIVVDGRGSWSVVSDLALPAGDLTLCAGEVHAARALIRARDLCAEGRGAKRLHAGSSVIELQRPPEPAVTAGVLDSQQAVLIVAGEARIPPPAGGDGGGPRDVNVCATGPGQTPFIATTSALTNYNGFNIRCRGECNATVTVTVQGGIGPFTYSWLNGGPNTATWTTACGGPQIVIVTDVGQGVSCGVTLNVTEPAPLGVIFFGTGTPPTCADVCNGSRTALAVGGVSPYTYSWNNGAGSGPSFSGLCAGPNTLRITDANGCIRDTAFVFDLQPIAPNLTSTNVTCNGACNGTATVSPTGGTGAITAVWTPAPGAGQGTFNATGLCAGNYTVQLTDANGCTVAESFTISEPPPIVPNPAQVNATCFGQCDGSASVAPTGSPGPFAYAWTPNVSTGPSASGLCAGSYSVLITDQATGCTATAAFAITSQPAFDVQGAVTPATCSDACNGAIAITIAGPPPPYTITWSPAPGSGQGTTSAGGLCPGLWQVTVATANGCDTTVAFTVPAPPPLQAILTADDASCAGVCDGSASVSVSGGTPGYTFLWSPAPGAGQGTANATGLCAGPHTLLITDANGCDTLVNFIINEPPPLQVTPSQTNVTCGGLCDGTASVAVSGGTPGYAYAWTPSVTGQGTPNATGLCAGSYSVLITDGNGCTFTQGFTILDAVPIQASLQVLPATCPSICDGSAGVIVTGGQAPYGYNWQPAPGSGQGTPNATGLCAQSYSLTITDFLGCDTTIAFTVPAPPPITVQSTIDNPDCADDCNGSIGLQVSGGNGSYTYLWAPSVAGQGTPNATALCAGSYQVTITSGACDTTLTFLLTAPQPITASGTTTPPTCAGQCDGSIQLLVSGGSPSYSFAWTPNVTGQGTPNAQQLCAGLYSVLVTDQAGCDTTLTFQLVEPLPITVSVATTPASCGGLCDGTATATVTGGIGTYIYNWQTPPASGQGTPSATGYCPGSYTLTVTDASGCQAIAPFAISTPSGIDASGTVTPASCGNTCDGSISVVATGGLQPYTYTWSPQPGGGQGTANAFNLCPGNWSLQITDAAQCDTVLLFTVTAPAAIIPNPSQTDETCNGPCDGTATVNPTGGSGAYTYLWSPPPPVGQGTNSIAQLCPGLWSVTITDATGCDTTVVFDILPKVPLDNNLVWTGQTCFGACDGTATVAPTGGTPPYTIIWNPEPPAGQGTTTASGLCIGLWEVNVIDDNGCQAPTPFFVDAPPPFTASLVVTPETCAGPCTGTATVAPSGGTGAISILWSPAPGGGQGTATATGLCAGTSYTVTLSDGNGCDSTFAFTVPPFAPIIPNSNSTPVSCSGVCDGTATVDPAGGTPPYTFLWSPGGQTSPSVSGLCEGVATVTITDAAGCSIDAQVLITGPPPIDAGATVNGISCNGQCDGSIVLNVTGGTAPYSYVWSPAPPNGQGQGQALSLCAGLWSVAIADGAGCTASFSFDLTPPDALTLQVATTPSECQVCIGTATATVSGGAGPYQIEWYDAGGTLVGTGTDIIGQCAGVYTAVVADANGCTLQQAGAITDSNGEAITANGGSTSCPNACDGSVSASFTCADPPCTIAWFDAQGNDLQQSGSAISGLCPGDYLVQVTNASGCISIETATVTAPPPTSLLISSTPASCAGACDGTATVGVSGGIPPYTWTWAPPPGGGQGTPLATGLCAGVYTVLISDGGGCDTTAQVLILEPQPLAVNPTIAGVACAGDCNGSIALAISGGTAPYGVVWSPVPPNGQGAQSATGLCAGDYTVVVTDASGCSFTATYTIADPQPLQASVSTVASTCPNCDGQASVSVSGGTAPYTIAWSLGGNPVGTGPAISSLCGGLYAVNVIDAGGCSIALTAQVADSNADPISTTNGQVGCANDCDGTVSASFTCTAPPCLLTWFDAQGNVIAQNTGSVGNLCVGTYTGQLTNGNGCVSFADAQVLPAQVIAPNLSSTPASCAGACDGAATVGPTGGVQPYTYAWSPGGQTTPQATGLCAGAYTVLITDAAQCDTTVQVLILEPQPLAINGTVQDALCTGDCNGAVSVIVTGGTLPYSYAWSPAGVNGQGTPAVTGLCPGSYALTVTDGNGCSITQAFTVNDPPPLQASVSTTLSECGLCDGTATAAISGGTAPYFAVWTSGAAIIGTGETIGGLCAGFYNVSVTDASLCAVSALVVVSDVDGEVLTITDGITTCPGDCDGAVSVDFNCAQPDCVIAWFDASGNDLGQNGDTLSNLCAGYYFVQVTNGIGCITIDTAFVTEPDPIAPNLSTTPASCAGLCDGTATVGPTGGLPPYGILWSPGGETTPQVTGLCAGPYSVTITDQAGCSITQDVLILEPLPLSVTGTSTPITCNGACDGAITATASGGTQPYTYLWTPAPPGDPGQPAITGLCAGDWTVTVTDDNGCAASATFTLDDPLVLEAQVSTTDNLCFGDCQGAASAAITGGVAPYGIVWRDAGGSVIAQGVTDVSGLCAGAYTLEVTDANGCALIVPFTIAQGAPISASLLFTNETCFGPCDGTASITPSGGAGGFGITWLDPSGIIIAQDVTDVSGLCAGNNSVVITDALGCDSTYAFTTLPYQPIADNATVSDVLCNGACDGSIATAATGGIGAYSYNWVPVPPNGQGGSSATSLCPGSYALTITDGVGCSAQFSYAIAEPPPLTATIDQVAPASCATASDGAISASAAGGTPPYSFDWSGPGGFDAQTEDIASLAPGSYTLTVTDDNGCSATVSAIVDALATVVADAGADAEECAGVPITLDGSGSTGAVNYAWTNAQGVTVGTSATLSLSGLAPGTYAFTLTVSDGPCFDSDQVIVTILDLPIADAGPDQVIFLSETVQIGGSPTGPQGATFSWAPDSLLSSGALPNPLADPPVTTWFVVTVVAPNGCADTDSVLVTVVPDIRIPTGFTPNGDGRNDAWIIDFIELFPDCEVEIYNRWGELLFRSVGYRTPWDGRYNGGFVPVGTYYYVVKLNDPRFPDPYTGPLTVIR